MIVVVIVAGVLAVMLVVIAAVFCCKWCNCYYGCFPCSFRQETLNICRKIVNCTQHMHRLKRMT